MAEKIGLEALFEDKDFRKGIENYTRQVQGATKETESSAKEITKSTKGIGAAWESVGGIVAGVISTYMVKKLAQAAWQLGELGATATRQRTAFEELAGQAGGSSDEILAAIKRATDGTVANSDIILAANKGILLGLGAQADQWEDLSEVARYRARAMGLSVNQALNDITIGIGRQSRLVLDNLGIILDTDKVYADYAKSINKTADALTNAEQKQAFMTAVIRDGQEQIRAAGGIVSDTADDFERLAATIKNAQTELGEALAPTVSDVASTIEELVPLFTDELIPALALTAEAVGDLIIILTELAAGPVAQLVTKFAGDLTQMASSIALFAAAGQGKITWIEAIAADIEAAKIKTNEGTEAMTAFIDAVIGSGPEIEQAAQGWMASIGGVIPVTREATVEAQKYAAALAGVNVVIGEMTPATDAEIKGMHAAAKAYHKRLDERKKAQEKALKAMQANEESYANALSQLYDQIVDTAEQAEQDRLQANEDYTREALALEQDLARQRADIERDLGRELADITRQLGQDRIDALTDLNRDLVDLDTDLAEDNEKTWKSYYATLESLAEAHGEKLKAITEKYAAQRASIEDKYRTTPTRDEEITSERERLQRELEALGRPRGFMERQQQAEILAALQALKDEELAIITAAQEEEIAAEETAYQEQQTQAAQRREEQLTANQEQIDKEAEQLQLGYERKLEDLRVAAEREREERNIAARQQLDDLRARGDEQRAELAAGHRARLAEIERGLAAETQGFRDAYNTQLSDLQTYLNQRTQQWRDHQREIENILGIASPSKWMQDIGKNMRLGLDAGFQGPSIATDLQQAVASFGQAANSLSLPTAAGGGASNVSNTNYTDNLNFRATFTQPETERSVRDMLRLNQNMLRMRRGG